MSWRVLVMIAGLFAMARHLDAQEPQDDPLSQAEAIVKAAGPVPAAIKPVQLLSLVVKLDGTSWGYSDVRCTFFANGTFEHIDILNDRRKAKGTWKQTGASVTATASYSGKINQDYPFKLSITGKLDRETLRGTINYSQDFGAFGGIKSETEDISYRLQE